MPAYACRVTPENMGAIASEFGKRKWDLQEAMQWLEEHGDGWFLRDDSSPLDCHFFEPTVFFEMYAFDGDSNSLFRRVIKL